MVRDEREAKEKSPGLEGKPKGRPVYVKHENRFRYISDEEEQGNGEKRELKRALEARRHKGHRHEHRHERKDEERSKAQKPENNKKDPKEARHEGKEPSNREERPDKPDIPDSERRTRRVTRTKSLEKPERSADIRRERKLSLEESRLLATRHTWHSHTNDITEEEEETPLVPPSGPLFDSLGVPIGLSLRYDFLFVL